MLRSGSAVGGAIRRSTVTGFVRRGTVGKVPIEATRWRSTLRHARFWSRGGRSDLSIDCNWSLLRSWLRPHRGISQEKLPLSLGFFEFVHNVRKRGKALLSSLIELLVSKDPEIQ
jgi:hypothetical protein